MQTTSPSLNTASATTQNLAPGQHTIPAPDTEQFQQSQKRLLSALVTQMPDFANLPDYLTKSTPCRLTFRAFSGLFSQPILSVRTTRALAARADIQFRPSLQCSTIC